MLVEGVFWCWLKGRFGGASLLMDGGGVLVGAFWCRGHFGGRNVLVGEVCWWGVFWGWLNGSWWSEAFNGWRGRFGGGGVLV